MFFDIVRFEWRYHTRRLSFVAASAVLLLAGFGATSRIQPGLETNLNAPYSLSFTLGLLSLGSVFVLTILCAQSILRDSEFRMAEIVYATAVTKAEYLFGRYLGVVAAAIVTFLAAIVGMVLGIVLPSHDPSHLGPHAAIDYLWPFAVLVVPNLIFVGALLFTVAATWRNAMTTYISGVALYMVYILAAMLADSPLIASSSPPTPEGLALAAWFDPFGLSAFFEQTHFWTPAERDTQHIQLTGYFLANRLLWIAAALSMLAVLYRFFAFRLRSGARDPVEAEGARSEPATTYRGVAPEHRRSALFVPALWSAIRMEAVQVMRRWPFWVLLMLWLGMNAIEIAQFIYNGEFGTQQVPATALVVGRIREPLMAVGLVILIYYSAETVWRERAKGIDQMVDATQASNAVFLLSKSASLSLMLTLLTAVAALVGIVFQVLHGQSPDLLAYAAQLYFIGLPLALVAMLAVFFQTISPNRYVGMLATVAGLAFFNQGAFGGPQHPLLRYAAAPSVHLSSMSGFGPSAAFFHPVIVYWTAVAGVLLLAAYGLWQRGTDLRLVARVGGLRRRFRAPARWIALWLLLVIATLGVSIFRQTNVLNAYETREQIADWRADYERSYRSIEDTPQPTPVHMEAEIDLYPQERRYRVRGRYTLENRTREPIETIYFGALTDVRVTNLRLEGVEPTEHDERFALSTFQLAEPLAPGGTVDLAYTVDVDRSAMAAGGTERDIVSNGSFVLNRIHMPRLGYRAARELTDPVARRRRDLPPRDRPETVELAQEMGLMDEQPMILTFDITLSTDADQVPIAPGRRVASWVDGDRRYASFTMDRPVHPLMAYVSARYEIERVEHRGVEVEIAYHPEHVANVPRFLDAATDALDYLSEQFGAYPHDHLRIVEIPGGRHFTGMAASGTTYFVETGGFLTNLGDPKRVDVVTKRVSHEVAHQWWGGVVSPATGPGSSVLVESTARYSELVLLEQRHGPGAVTAALGFERDRYLSGRAHYAEVPLYQAQREPFLFYSKGAMVMMAVRDLIGEEALNTALRAVVDLARSGQPPTSLDLLTEIRAVTPATHHDLLEQWWQRIVLYNLRIESAQSVALPDGRYQLKIRAFGGKHEVADDHQSELPMEEILEIGLYSSYPRTVDSLEGLLHVERRVVMGTTEIEMVVDELPRYVSIDPFLRRIERNLVDNVVEVEAMK
ncbi:MAG: hypothetical protein MPN21_20775 [Thermoanaerobaculia bacterium]|nr:hypothetical protein [Thermoanaerobaculia bacterium]